MGSGIDQRVGRPERLYGRAVESTDMGLAPRSYQLPAGTQCPLSNTGTHSTCPRRHQVETANTRQPGTVTACPQRRLCVGQERATGG